MKALPPVANVPSPILKVSDFGCGIALAAYVTMVLYNGNIKLLWQDALEDYGYLEWLVAIAILYAIYRSLPQENKLIGLLIAATVIAVLLKLGTSTTITQRIKDFGAGKAGLFATITGGVNTQSTTPTAIQTTAPVQLPATQTTPAITTGV